MNANPDYYVINFDTTSQMQLKKTYLSKFFFLHVCSDLVKQYESIFKKSGSAWVILIKHYHITCSTYQQLWKQTAQMQN